MTSKQVLERDYFPYFRDDNIGLKYLNTHCDISDTSNFFKATEIMKCVFVVDIIRYDMIRHDILSNSKRLHWGH